MSLYKNLFKQTAIYGIATVVPRMFSFLLTPLYTDLLPQDEYGEVSIIFSWMVLFNVILAYGMETSFFRFYSNAEDKDKVQATSTVSLFWSSVLFLGGALLARDYLAQASGIDVNYIIYTIWVLVLDALVIIPFSKLRAEGRPMYYAAIKIGNVAVNLGLNVFFLVYLPKLTQAYPGSIIETMYVPGFQIGYIFIANLIASLLTFIVLIPHYFKISWHIDKELWKRMMRYSLPVLVAGIAFAINETFDRIILQNVLTAISGESYAEAEVGIYSACYKLAIFMTLFATAFRLGIEPFFFSHSKNENAPKTYAMITKYFVVFGSVILLVVVVFSDFLKELIIRDEAYWEGMKVVPLIIIANFFLGIYHNLSVWYKLSDKTKMGAYISIVGAVITLALNYALIPQYSYMGSAIATIAAYGTMMGLSFILGSRYYPIPYDIKMISLYLGISILFSLVYFYQFRGSYIVGGAMLLFFGVFIYLNEKDKLLRIIRRR